MKIQDVNARFRNIDLFPSLGKKGGKAATYLGQLDGNEYLIDFY
jgi:hypothetical protein